MLLYAFYQPPLQRREAFSDLVVAHGHADGAAVACQDAQALGTGDGGVEQACAELVEALRWSIMVCWVTTGSTTAGNSEPCALCTEMA